MARKPRVDSIIELYSLWVRTNSVKQCMVQWPKLKKGKREMQKRMHASTETLFKKWQQEPERNHAGALCFVSRMTQKDASSVCVLRNLWSSYRRIWKLWPKVYPCACSCACARVWVPKEHSKARIETITDKVWKRNKQKQQINKSIHNKKSRKDPSESVSEPKEEKEEEGGEVSECCLCERNKKLNLIFDQSCP